MLASTRARILVGVLVLLVLASAGTYAFVSLQKPAAASAVATLTVYKGTAQRAPAGSATFSAALTGQALNNGDQVRTGPSTAAAIRFGDGSITRLDSSTAITITALRHQGSSYQTSFSQSAGKTWNKVQALVGLASFNVTGPNSSTAEVRGTTFVLIIEPNGDVRVDDYQGTVIFHGRAGQVTVSTGQSSTILNGTGTPQPTTGIPTADLQDPFTIFNIAADANLGATGNGDILSVNANNTIAVAETQGAFLGGGADGNSDLSFTLDWPGSTFELVIIDPDGVEYDSVVSDQHPVTYTVPKPRAGDWSYRVHDITSEKPKENWSVVVGAVRPAKQTPTLFFRGGSKQVCDHTVVGGKADTWSLNARDAAGAPALTTSELPAYATFTNSHGSGTFKFTPPLDVAPADIAITVTAGFGANTTAVSCTEHVVPPKNASIAGSVLSSGSGVPGVLVTVKAPDSSTQIAYSDGSGNFGFSGLGAGSFTLSMTVPNGYKASGPTSQAVTLDGNTAGPPVTFQLLPFAISVGALPNGSVGDPSCSVLTVLGGTPPFVWSVSAGAMPPGTGFDVYGHCNGTPTTAGTYNFTLSVTDADGATASHGYTVTIFAGPSINGPAPAGSPITNLAPWDQGFANPQTLTGAGGIAPYGWSVVSGSLPTSMSLGASTGTLGGGPTVNPGVYAATVQLTDAAGAKAYRPVRITVLPPPKFQNTTWQDNAVLNGGLLNAFFFRGGQAPYTVTASKLPPGVTASVVTQNGEGGPQTLVRVTGSPGAIGDFTPSLVLHDAVGGSSPALGGLIHVIAVPLAIQAPATIPPAIVGVPFSATFTITGGLPTPTWSGSFPPGLTVTNGVVSGTPSQAGCYQSSYVGVYDSFEQATAPIGLDVLPAASAIAFCTQAGLPAGDIGLPYSQQMTAIGGAAPLQFSLSGNRPGSLTISPTGLLNSPAFAGNEGPSTWSFNVDVTDGGNNRAQLLVSLPVFRPPTLGQTTLGPATTGVFYNQNLPVSTFALGPLTLTVTGGTAPPGVGIFDCGSSQPCLFGTPTSAGAFTFTLQAQDGFGQTVPGADVQYSLTVGTSPLVFSNPGPNLSAGMVGDLAYRDQFFLSGGSQPYTWARTGTLPPGLSVSLGPTGDEVFSGAPTAAGTYTSTYTVTDSLAATASITYTIVIDPTLAISTATLPAGDAGTPYSQPVVATGGKVGGPLSFALNQVCSLSGGCQPLSNLQIDPATGVVSTIATPTPGIQVFQVAVSDPDGNQATMDYSIVFADPLAIKTTSLPNAAQLGGYCQSLSAGGGTPGYTWAVTIGAVPTGLNLDAWGHLTGTPTVAGVYAFTVTATDAVGAQVQQAYTITIT